MKRAIIKEIIITVIIFITTFIFTLILLMIFSSTEKYGNSTIYTKDNKVYEISEDYKLNETKNYLEIDTGSDVIRIPWDNISSWE